MSIKWGSIMVIITFVVVQILISSPLFMAYMILASYSRRSYIRFWDCVPLMKGLGYSIALTKLFAETFNISFIGLAMYYLYILITNGDVPWKDCNFPRANKDCIALTDPKAKFLHSGKCCRTKDCGKRNLTESSAKFASLDYYMSFVLEEGYEEEPLHYNLLLHWSIAVAIVWVILYLFMLIGLRNFRKLFWIVDIIFLITVIPAVILTIALSPGYEVMDEMEASLSNILNSEMWLDFVEHYLYNEVPGDVIALSALSLPLVSSTTDTVIIFTCKIVWGAMSVVWASITGKFIENHYKIEDDVCVMVRGDYLFFVMLPDVLSWCTGGYTILILYFLIIIIWNLFLSMCVVTNAIEAMAEELRLVNKYRAIVGFIIFGVVCGFNINMLRPNFMDAYWSYVGYTFPAIIATQLLAAWIGMFCYSIHKLTDDYHFTFGEKLSSSWIIGLKLGTIVFCILLKLLYDQRLIADKGSIALYCGLLWPIPAGICVMLLRYYMRINKSLLDSTKEWGPPAKRKRHTRAFFDPTRDLKYRTNVQRCKHHCLIRSFAIKREIRFWQSKYDIVLVHLKEENVEVLKIKHRSVDSFRSTSSVNIIN
ncbi:sodium-dependent noradrenaline transporter-like [Onthophagus taurus]|uniref:sodium-dependent noradrenaline transporter-like n=1 Tax=Onthophagus taurus TaxID=166361 RepID=UPI0039BE1223